MGACWLPAGGTVPLKALFLVVYSVHMFLNSHNKSSTDLMLIVEV